MSSGMENVVLNSLERLVSTDHNRLQKFKARDVAEAFRYLLDVSCGTEDLDAGGVPTEFLTQENPLRAEVFSGLLARPQIGSLNVLVDAGLLYCVDPDASPSPDDSVYKFIRSPGVPNVGGLVMTANASGSIRIDVIECQRTNNADQVVETDSRDLFNPSTGLFTATTVTKATQGTLTFRVRAGTAGSGFPGTAAGWLPLAVASVAAGATTCDQMTFWDVRPLLSDRAHGLQNVSAQSCVNEAESQWDARVTTAIVGLPRARVHRRIAGGLVSGESAIDATSAANQEPGFAPANLWHLYLLFPFSLPRWARYSTSASGSRIPRGPRGIAVVSATNMHDDASPVSAVSLPTATGLLGSTTEGVCVGSGWNNGGTLVGWWGDNEHGMFFSAGNYFVNPNGGASIGVQTYTIDRATQVPGGARSVCLQFRCFATVTSAGAVKAEPYVVFLSREIRTGGGTVNAVGYAGGELVAFYTRVWVEIPHIFPRVNGSGGTFTVQFIPNATGNLTYVSANVEVVGWRF